MTREATPADRPAVGALQQLLDEPAPALLDAAFDAGAGFDARPGFDAGVASVLVAERDGAPGPGAGPDDGSTSTDAGHSTSVVGYALAVLGAAADATAGPADAAADPAVAYLAELVVAPGMRRQGVATELVTALCERLAAHDQLRVTARADDHGVRAFYRDQGFRAVADLPGYYGGDASAGRGEDESTGGRDGVLLVRDLQ